MQFKPAVRQLLPVLFIKVKVSFSEYKQFAIPKKKGITKHHEPHMYIYMFTH